LNHSREIRKLKLLCKSYALEKDRRVDFELEILGEEIEQLEFSEENSQNSEDHRIQESGRGELSIGQIHLRKAGFNVDH
jgi:hypothetical protein